jgi:signal transduction histidine kinase
MAAFLVLCLPTVCRTGRRRLFLSVNTDSDRSVEINLASYLQEVATLIHTRIVQNGGTLEVSAPLGLHLPIVADALTETLSRILVNVLDHGFSDGLTGTLRIEAHLDESDANHTLVITVSDDGHGIAPDDLPKVFDPFFTTKSGIHGHVGLGLHVAYNHVTQRLKGHIHIASTLGAGTRVTIRLKNKL